MKRFLTILMAFVMTFGCLVCFIGCDGEGAGTETTPAAGSSSADSSSADSTSAESTSEETTEETTAETTEAETTKYNGPLATEGKVCATFGDSITWYDGNAYNWGKEKGKVAIGYQHYMEEELKFSAVYNCGFSGHTMPQIIGNLKGTQYASVWNTVDYLTIMSGANDQRHGVAVGEVKAKGSTFDTATYTGALQSGIEYVLAKNPDITIVLFTPIKGWIYAPAGYGAANPQTQDGVIEEKYADAVKAVAELYDLTVCDLYNDSGIDYEIADRQAYMNDPEPPENTLYSLHPNTAGYKIMSEAIIDTFIEISKVEN